MPVPPELWDDLGSHSAQSYRKMAHRIHTHFPCIFSVPFGRRDGLDTCVLPAVVQGLGHTAFHLLLHNTLCCAFPNPPCIFVGFS